MSKLFKRVFFGKVGRSAGGTGGGTHLRGGGGGGRGDKRSNLTLHPLSPLL